MIFSLFACTDKSVRFANEAEMARIENDLELADSLYQKALAINHDNALIHNNYGILLQMQKKWPEAQQHFEKALSMFTTPRQKAIALNNIGLTFDLQQQYAQAKQYYNQSIAMDPNYHESMTNLASIQVVEKEYEQAIETVKRALKILETSEVLYKAQAIETTAQFLVVSYQKLGQLDLAEQVCSGLLQLNPFNIRNYLLMGDIQILKNNFNASRDVFMRAMSIQPQNTEAKAGYALTLALLGEGEKAIEEISAAIELDETSVITHERAAQLYNALGKKEQSLQSWEKVLALDPKHDNALSALGFDQTPPVDQTAP